MKVGDYVKLKKYGIWKYESEPKDRWKVVSFNDETVTVKAKDVGGEFTFRREAVIKVYKKEEVK